MFIKKLKENFNLNEPIFTKEILELFNNYSRAYVFRLIDSAVERKEIIKYDTGIYYIPEITSLGLSILLPDDVIRKKYLQNDDDVYGIYCGLKLLNGFSVTTQMPSTIEIVSNNESTRCRKLILKGRTFILRKSRCKIDRNNLYAYIILQLLTEAGIENDLNDELKKNIREYMETTKTDKKALTDLLKYFPLRTTKNLILSGIINDFTI